MVKDQAQVFLAGPPLVKMATGEEAEVEELGGAEMHARISGLADHLAEDELDAIRVGREIVAMLDWRKAGPGPRPGMPVPPVHDPAELNAIVSADVRVPFAARDESR